MDAAHEEHSLSHKRQHTSCMDSDQASSPLIPSAAPETRPFASAHLHQVPCPHAKGRSPLTHRTPLCHLGPLPLADHPSLRLVAADHRAAVLAAPLLLHLAVAYYMHPLAAFSVPRCLFLH
jgi:hypothetical protein